VKQYQRMSEIEVRFFDFPPLLRAHGKVFGSNGFNRIEQCRRVAARYDKLAANGLAFIQLGSISERHFASGLQPCVGFAGYPIADLGLRLKAVDVLDAAVRPREFDVPRTAIFQTARLHRWLG